MKTRQICIMDIGSNSVRMVIYKIIYNKFFVVEKDMKESVRLGSDLKLSNNIQEEKRKILLNTLSLFKKICIQSNVDEIIAFGTAALREAANGPQIVEEIKNNLNIDISIITGVQEASFSFNGAINNLDIDTGGFIDLGGSSLEVVYFENRKIVHAVSLRFGALTLLDYVNSEGIISKEGEAELVGFVQKELENIPWKNKLKGLPIIGVGGSIRNIATVHLHKNNYPLDYVHNYILDKDDLKETLDFVKHKNLKEKLEIKGLSKARADIFSGALIAIKEVVSFLEAKSLVLSQYGIREGVLYDELSRTTSDIRDPFIDNIKEVMALNNIDTFESMEELQVFKKIYSKIKSAYSLNGITEKVIKISVIFSEIGKRVNYVNYPLHSANIILNMGLKGITHKEIISAALVISRGTKKYKGLDPYVGLFTEKEISEIMMTSKILNITKILYKDFVSNESQLEIEVSEDKIIFYLINKSQDDLEILKLFISQKKFINSFDKKIEFKLKQI